MLISLAGGVVALYTRSRAGWTRDVWAFVSKTAGAMKDKVALSKCGRRAGEGAAWKGEDEIVRSHVSLMQEVRAPCMHSYTIPVDGSLCGYGFK